MARVRLADARLRSHPSIGGGGLVGMSSIRHSLGRTSASGEAGLAALFCVARFPIIVCDAQNSAEGVLTLCCQTCQSCPTYTPTHISPNLGQPSERSKGSVGRRWRAPTRRGLPLAFARQLGRLSITGYLKFSLHLYNPCNMVSELFRCHRFVRCLIRPWHMIVKRSLGKNHK